MTRMIAIVAPFAFALLSDLLLFDHPSSADMRPFPLHHILQATGGELRSPGAAMPVEAVVDGIGIDSRTIQPNEVFWALSGTNHDGHEFIHNAVRRGAAAAVVREDRYDASFGPAILVSDTLDALSKFAAWHRARHDAVVIGVTGSFGKTTTREMIFSALSAAYAGLRSPKNYNNHIGVPLTMLELSSRHEFAVVELAASAVGEIRELTDVAAPEFGVVTGIGPAHLDGFGSLEGVISAKSELLQALPENGFAVLAGDDSHVRWMARQSPAPVIFVGESDENHVQAERIETTPECLRFQVDGRSYAVRATGRHHVTAALSAVAIGREIGLSPGIIADGLAEFRPPPGRCQWRRIGPWNVIDDTYNANPASMRAACELLRDLPVAGRRLLIAGDMRELGDEAKQHHRNIGRVLGQSGIDHVLTHGRLAADIIAGARESGLRPWQLAECDTLDSLLAVLDCWLEPDDVILVKGSRLSQMERVVNWLTEQAEHISKENTARMPMRACA